MQYVPKNNYKLIMLQNKMNNFFFFNRVRRKFNEGDRLT